MLMTISIEQMMMQVPYSSVFSKWRSYNKNGIT